MNLYFKDDGWDDYLYWQKQDRKKLARINELIVGAWRTPNEGIGKPEPLKGNFAGYWSRRINREHRFVYRSREIDGDKAIEIVQLRGHY